MSRAELVERAVRRGKYAPLYHHLRAQQGDRLELTFAELERVLGFQLPDSARIYRPWWANQAKSGHSQAMAWGAAGWKTAAVDLEGETLRFEREASIRTERAANHSEHREVEMSDAVQYWVYENWTHEKAMIHEGRCSYCNDGRGIHGGSGNRNGRWHGPFGSRNEAERKAAATGRQLVRACKSCLGAKNRNWPTKRIGS